MTDIRFALSGYLWYLMNSAIKGDNHTVWSHIGYWRHLINIKVLLDQESFDTIIFHKEKDSFQWMIKNENEIHHVLFHSKNDSLITLITDNRESEFEFRQDAGDSVLLFNGKTYRFKKDFSSFIKEQERNNTSQNEQKSFEVKSPMPGKIHSILVSPGMKVTAGKIMLILEAMKMENNIHSECNGIVESLPIKKGSFVNKGDVLVRLSIKN